MTTLVQRLLLRVRPAGLAQAIKKMLRIRRRLVPLSGGWSMWLDPVSNLGNSLLQPGGYEPIMSSILPRLLRAGDVFIDVGANEGYFSLLAATAQPAALIHAIEPEPANAAVLQRNVSANGLSQVVVHACAIAARDGPVRMTVPTTVNSGVARLEQVSRDRSALSPPISAITLDTFFAAHCPHGARVVKIDCEGAEQFVFQGASRVLAERSVAFFFLEYHPTIIGEEACRTIDARLRVHGYDCSRLNGLWIYHPAELIGQLRELGSPQPVPPV